MEVTIFAWLAKKLAPAVLPLTAILLLTNIGSGVGLLITRHTLAEARQDAVDEEKFHQGEIALVQAASETAQASDLEHARMVQAQQDHISQEKQDDLSKQLVDARAAVAAWVRSHPAAKAVGSGGKAADLPALANGSSQPDPEADQTVIPVSDAEACATAYIVATGWQDWYADQVKNSVAVGAPAGGQAGTQGATGRDGTADQTQRQLVGVHAAGLATIVAEARPVDDVIHGQHADKLAVLEQGRNALVGAAGGIESSNGAVKLPAVKISFADAFPVAEGVPDQVAAKAGN